MTKRPRPLQRFVIEFPGPLPDEADAPDTYDLQEHLRFCIEQGAHGLTDGDELFYARLDEIVVRPEND